MILHNYIVKIYKSDKFVGYVKSYRTLRTGLYSFERTKNINEALKNSTSMECARVSVKLATKRYVKIYFL